MPIGIFEGSHRIVRAVHQSPVRKLRGVSVARLVIVPPFSELVANGDTFYTSPAWTNENMAFICLSDTIGYHVHFVEERYSLQGDIHYFSDFEPRYPQPPSTRQVELSPLMKAACGKSPVVE